MTRQEGRDPRAEEDGSGGELGVLWRLCDGVVLLAGAGAGVAGEGEFPADRDVAVLHEASGVHEMTESRAEVVEGQAAEVQPVTLAVAAPGAVEQVSPPAIPPGTVADAAPPGAHRSRCSQQVSVLAVLCCSPACRLLRPCFAAGAGSVP